MTWLQLKISTSSEHIDLLCETLTETGASAVTFIDSADQPIYEPELGTTPYWQQTTLIGLFAANVDAQAIIENIRLKHGDDVVTSWVSEPLKDQVWEKAWMDQFEPMKFGENLWVCPSWKAVPDPKGVNIMLDPGLAFGTGTHPTTALCLEVLARYAMRGLEIIDYGCGSGILAIASVKLGADKAWCIDNDPQALLATKENAKKNQVTDKIQLGLPNDELITNTKADLLIANILAKPLVNLAPHFAQLLNNGAGFILSGILEDQEQEIVQAYSPLFDISCVTQSEEWLCIQGTRKN